MRRFNNIICVVEHGKESKPALDKAVTLAEHNQAKLTVVEVIPRVPAGIGMPDGGPISRDLRAAMVSEHEARLVSLIEPYRERLDVKHDVLTGTSFLEIIRAVLRNGHDLVVKCPESPDWLDRLFSGDDMHLLRKCPCPVWMIRPEVGESYQRILAAVDVDDSYPPEELETRRALNSTVMELAGSLAVSEFAELHVVNVWRAMFENTLRHSAFLRKPEDEVDAYVEQVRRDQAQRLDELMRETGAKLGPDAMDYIKPQLHLLKGEAREEIPALAKRLQVDCIIMGTVARTGIRGFIMGNTAETILDQIDCSVLAIKPPGFVTPVELEE
jgi:nucleotide-binding universal stress UspA family protein